MLNIGKPTKSTVDSEIHSVCNGVYVTMLRCHRLYSVYLTYTDADLQAMGYGTDDIYAIRAACVAMENMYAHYNATTPLDASKPAQYIEPLVQPLVI